MVTAGNGVIIFQGQSGKTYSVNFYSSDVSGAPCTFNINGNAISTSPTYWVIPENVTLLDIAFVSSNTVSLSWTLVKNGGLVAGQVFQIASQLTTLNNRPKYNIGIAAGVQLGLQQN